MTSSVSELPRVASLTGLIVSTTDGVTGLAPLKAAAVECADGITVEQKLADIFEYITAHVSPLATQTAPGMAKGSDTVIVDAEGGLHAVGMGGSTGAGGAFVGQWVFLRQFPLPAGYVALDGKLYTGARDKFPELMSYLASHPCEITTDDDWQARSAAASGTGGVPFYVHDAVENTLRMPDTRGDSPYHGAVGTWEGDKIRNITGAIEFPTSQAGAMAGFSGLKNTGALSTVQSVVAGLGSGNTSLRTHNVTFNASNSVPTASTNHPRRIGMTLAVYAGTIGA